tara:strand:- start:656 stop:1534 length:879 start_codon:yes stop_codon:yes gene_type:complete
MIAVLMGGNSAERDVSLKSGEAVYKALVSKNIDCFKFDWNGDNLNKLWEMSFDKVFIVLHGRGGEDGFIQKQLEEKSISYTGSNSKSSKIGMDKSVTKSYWSSNNLPVAPSVIANSNKSLPIINFPLPWAVKPTLEGSSIGISKVGKESQLDDALKLAWKYDENAMVEKWIEGGEYTVAILNNKSLPTIKIIADNNFYNYESKYISDNTQYLCPADLDPKQEAVLQTLALQAFKVLGAKDWGRVDFIIDNNNNPFLLEINTVPGMTDHSLVPMAAKAANISFNELVATIANN